MISVDKEERELIPNAMFIISLGIVAALGFGCNWLINREFSQARTEWQAERKDLLDRLMARDLPEVKQAQALENRATGSKPTSKRQNDARLMQLAEKAERE